LVLFAAIVLLAFALRLTYVLQLRSSPLFEHPQMDELYHDQWAQAIAAGETFNQGPYFRAPLYPAFLGAVYAVFGHDYLAARVIQALLGSLSCGLLFLVGRLVFSRVIGAVAGVIGC
jgi:predicted membrane-bound mannosyltransferase